MTFTIEGESIAVRVFDDDEKLLTLGHLRKSNDGYYLFKPGFGRHPLSCRNMRDITEHLSVLNIG